jgi:hypothetical protein
LQDLKFKEVGKIFADKHGYSFDVNTLISEIQKPGYRINWKNRLANQIPNLPDFEKVESDLEKLIKKRFSF